MRNIPDAALALIADVNGIEPINIIRIWWTVNGYIDYADREIEEENVRGSLLELSQLEDVINLDQSSSSTNISIRLDDSNGDLKEIYDNVDIHRIRVQVFQWFTELPIDSKFVIFEGEIASPVIWRESDRTLEFDVLSKLEDREVGFSADEASFAYVPPGIVGKPWPLIFGTVNAVPAIRVNDVPTGLSGDEIGSVDQKTRDLVEATNLKNANDFKNLFQYYWTLAIQAYATADRYTAQQVKDRQDGLNTDYSSIIQQFNDQGDQFVATANEYLREYYDLINGTPEDKNNALERQRIEKTSIPVANAAAFPQSKIGSYKINGIVYEGYFDKSNFNVTKRAQVGSDDYIPVGLTQMTSKTGFTRYDTQLPPDSFIYAQGGSDVRVATNYPITYIVSIGHSTVIGVQAYRSNILTGVPPNYYTIEHRTSNSFKYTVLVMKQPLSSIDSAWEDDIYMTVQGEVGNSMIDVIVHLIQTYTPYTYDPASFGLVRFYTDYYPVNFAVLNQPNVFTLLREIAFQSRCSIWFNDGKFFMKYLPILEGSIETIGQDDVDLGSIEITYTNTEDLATKFVASWKAGQQQTEANKIIFRNNISKYGTILREYDFYTYNDQRLVEKSAEFWTIRYSNTWKRITFRTFLHKLKIETWDTITLNADMFVANEAVPAIVESSKYDSATSKLIISCWVPVRAGEMYIYPFAHPGDLPIEYVYPVVGDPQPGSPTAPNASGHLYDQNTVVGNNPASIKSSRARADRGRNIPSTDAYDNGFDYTVGVQLDSREIRNGTQPSFSGAKLKQYTTTPAQNPAFQNQENNGIFFAIVQDKVTGNKYNCDVYTQGINAAPKTLVCEQFVMRSDETIPALTPTIVFQRTELEDQGNGTSLYVRKYYMQVPVWVRPQSDI